jgi:glycosyltransferase involved in cell wall biosynthesis
MLEPLVSVLVPVHNAGPFLRDAVESVVAQTYRNLEIIVIDDGSTDDCIASIEDLGDSRIRLIRQPNRGKAAALNRAMSLMSGEYYFIQDADDLSYSTRVVEQVRCLQDHPDLAGLFCGYDIILEGRRLAPQFRGKDRRDCERDIAAYRMPGHDPTCAFRTSTVRHLQYDESLRVGQGYDYVLRIGEQFPVMVLGQCLYSYRVTRASNTRLDSSRREKYVHEILCKARCRRGADESLPDPSLHRHQRTPRRVTDNNLAAAFIESVLDQRMIGRRLSAMRTGLQCCALSPLDPHYHKAFVYSVSPSWLARSFRQSGTI